jgi:hypothetical protein
LKLAFKNCHEESSLLDRTLLGRKEERKSNAGRLLTKVYQDGINFLIVQRGRESERECMRILIDLDRIFASWNEPYSEIYWQIILIMFFLGIIFM